MLLLLLLLLGMFCMRSAVRSAAALPSAAATVPARYMA
jgi:hypothetical protein